MKAICIILSAMLWLTPQAGMAQRGKKKQKAKPKVEEPVEDPRLALMRASTQQVVFVDSIVVDERDFISAIPLSDECGRLKQMGTLGQYTNEMGDHRLTAIKARGDSVAHIMSSDFVGNDWSEPTAVKGLGSDGSNYPYLMPDGTTLYFAQRGEKSIGGYDIFVTRYDAESGAYLKPENLGMPFASEANDLLYVIDEHRQLGYFVTDRRQPRGKVCVYTFIPTTARRTYNAESMTETQLRALADIHRIADTWGNGEARKEALERLEKARTEATQAETATDNNSNEISDLRHQADVLEKALLLARDYYARAAETDREKMKDEILQNERELEQLQLTIKQKEKEQRNEQYRQQHQ